MAVPGAEVFRAQVNDAYVRQSRKLTEIDADVRARLQVAACAAMTRALKRSGAKLRTRLADKKYRGADTRRGIDTAGAQALIAGVPSRLVASVLGEAFVASIGFSDTKALAGADWSELRGQFMEWTKQAQRQALKVAAAMARLPDTDDRVAAAQRTMDDPRWPPGGAPFEEALDGIIERLLYTAEGDASAITFDPNTVVPTGVVRTALTIVGGAKPKALKADAGDVVDVSDAGDVGDNPDMAMAGVTLEGGIGNGEAIGDMLSGAGLQVATYEWIHGPSMRPFEPHEDLDGVSFSSFDDDVLANPDDFPENQYFFPGDHDGCSCDFSTTWGPADDADTGDGDAGGDEGTDDADALSVQDSDVGGDGQTAWSASMSDAAAQGYTEGSALPDVYYHGTMSDDAADAIRNNGFDAAFRGAGTGNQGTVGAGFYLTSVQDYAAQYAGWEDDRVLPIRLDGQEPNAGRGAAGIPWRPEDRVERRAAGDHRLCPLEGLRLHPRRLPRARRHGRPDGRDSGLRPEAGGGHQWQVSMTGTSSRTPSGCCGGRNRSRSTRPTRHRRRGNPRRRTTHRRD